MEIGPLLDKVNDLDNNLGCQVIDKVQKIFKEPNEKEPFVNGIYVLDCRIIDKRMEVLEHGELKKEDVKGVVLHQTNGSVAATTMGRYRWDNIKNSISELLGRKKIDGIGAHFLISPDGQIYQTARIDRMCYHVGPYLNSLCYKEKKCEKSELAAIEKITSSPKLTKKQKWEAITDIEKKKDSKDRFSKNSDSIGIEIVGEPSKDGHYVSPSPKQIVSTNWLTDLLLRYFNLGCDRIFAHGQISPHKLPSEGIVALKEMKRSCKVGNIHK